MSSQNIIRISQLPKQDITNLDRFNLSQYSAARTYQLASIDLQPFHQYIAGSLTTSGAWQVNAVSTGVLGDGSVKNPFTVDLTWLKNNYQQLGAIQYSQVGNLKTKSLPLSLSTFSLYSEYNSSSMKAPITAQVNTDGELALWCPGSNAHKLSVGDWMADGNLDSSQLIERPFSVNGITGTVVGVISLTTTVALLKVNNSGKYETWALPVKDGNLNARNPDAIAIKLGDESDATGLFKGRSLSAVALNTIIYLFAVTDSVTNANAGGEVSVYQVSTTGGLTNVNSWFVSSYAGTYTGADRLRFSDQLIGTSQTNAEITDNTSSVTAQFVNSRNTASSISLTQDLFDLTKIYLWVRRDHLLTQNQKTQRYSHDLVFQITLAGLNGSAVAISQYLTNRPTLQLTNNVLTWSNQRLTFQGKSRADNENELVSLLNDGSIFVCGDRFDRVSDGALNVFKVPTGKGLADSLDIHTAASLGTYAANVEIDITPGYDSSKVSNRSLLVSSPIHVYVHSVRYTIAPDVFDLTSILNQTTTYTYTDLVTTHPSYQNVSGQKINIYAIQSGGAVSLKITADLIPEDIDVVWLGCAFYPSNGDLQPILISKAVSRIGAYRLSNQPQGMAIPVTEDHPGQSPSSWWMQEVKAGPQTPVFYADVGLTQSITSSLSGQTVYIKCHIPNSVYTETYRLKLGGSDFGTQNWIGSDLVFSGTIPTGGVGQMSPMQAVLTNVSQNTTHSQSALFVTDTPIKLEVLSTDQSSTLSTVYDGTGSTLRVSTATGVNGDVYQISVGGNVISNQTYQGLTITAAYTFNTIGVNAVVVTNTRTGFKATVNITVNRYAGIQTSSVTGTVDRTASTVSMSYGTNLTFVVVNLSKAISDGNRFYLNKAVNDSASTSITLNGNTLITGKTSNTSVVDITSYMVEGNNVINLPTGSVVIRGPLI